MSQRHTDGLLPDWFDLELEKLAPIPAEIRCCSCLKYIETRYYHEDEHHQFWCNECMPKARGMFWLREKGRDE